MKPSKWDKLASASESDTHQRLLRKDTLTLGQAALIVALVVVMLVASWVEGSY